MKKTLLSTFLLLFSVLLTFAAPVDEQSARKIASKFLSSKLSATTRAASGDLTRALTGVADGDDAGIYVFNTNNAFVIVSGDDSTPSVLGYSENGAFDKNNVPDGLKDILLGYQYVVRNSKATTRGEIVSHESIKPLIKTQWNQSGPYNFLCPYDSVNNATSATGCVATATAQIMNYFQWPAGYEWDKMKDMYENADSTEAGYAVAKLMKDVGEAVYMSYGANGSFASSVYVCEALRNNFSYSYSTEFVQREDYTVKEWDELIYSNLADGKPIYYAGLMVDLTKENDKWKGALAGHAFVVDGYDTDGLYHINWGWGGSSDGYFLLSVLEPSSQGIGGAVGSEGYSLSQEAVVNIAKVETPNTSDYRLYVTELSVEGNKTELNRSTTSVDFPLFKIQAAFVNGLKPLTNRTFDVGYALYQGEKMLSLLFSTTTDIDSGEGWYIPAEIIIGKDLTDGTYQIRPVCREKGKEDWVLCFWGYDCYFNLGISGTKLTIAQHGLTNDGSATKFVVNSKEVTTDNQVGRPITIKLNLTDKNKLSNSPIYLWGNEDVNNVALLTGVGTNLDAGETGDVTIHYTPQREGDYKFYLSGSDDNCEAVIDSFEVSVAAAVQFDLVVDIAYDVYGADEKRNVPGTTLKGNVKITNNSTGVYYGPVYILLYKNKAGTNSFSRVDAISTNTEIKVGETSDVPFNFLDLETDVNYAFLVYMIEKEDWKWVNFVEEDGTQYISGASIFKLVTDTGIEVLKADEPDADVYDMRGVRLGKAADLKSLPKGIYIINKKKMVNK